MSFSELDYLRFAYNCLDTSAKIAIQKYFPGNPPENYYIHLCQNCGSNLAQGICQEPNCEKLTCQYCAGYCSRYNKILCFAHEDKCAICKIGCACAQCRFYITEYICNTCSENDEISYTCGCLTSCKFGRCIHCDRKMNPNTKERF
jgi:hypothetical protein